MASESVNGEVVVPGNQPPQFVGAEATSPPPGESAVRTGAAVVAENHPPPLQELASREQPPHPPPPATTAPSPSPGPHGSQPSSASVESRPSEEQQLPPTDTDMVVPVKPGDAPDAKHTEASDRSQRPKTPSGSPLPASTLSRPPSSNGNAPASPSPIAKSVGEAGSEDGSSDMGAEGSKFSSGKFRKGSVPASSADIQPLEEKTGVAKRSASSNAGFFTRNGRSTPGMESSNGHRESVQSVAEEGDKIVPREKQEPSGGSRPSSRQGVTPPLGKMDDSNAKRKSPPMGSPSPIPGESRSPAGHRPSSKSSSPDIPKDSANITSPTSKTASPIGKQEREVVKTKTPSPDLTDAGRNTPDLNKGRISSPDIKGSDSPKDKNSHPEQKKERKSPSPELLKTKTSGSLHVSPGSEKLDKVSEETARSETPSAGIPGAEIARSKSPMTPKSKTPSPDLRNISPTETTSLKSASPEELKKISPVPRSPEPSKEKLTPQQSKTSTPSPEPVRTKTGSPEMLSGRPITPKPLKTKPSSPDLRKEEMKTNEVDMRSADAEIDKNNVDHSNIKRTKSPSVEFDRNGSKPTLKTKSSSPELTITKPVSPDPNEDQSRPIDQSKDQNIIPNNEISNTKTIIEDKTKRQSPEMISKSPSPDIPKSKPLSPDPPKTKAPEPPQSKPSTPEPSKLKTSTMNGSDTELRRPSSRLSNISDSDVKASPSPSPAVTKSPSPELEKPKSDSPDVLKSRKKSPDLQNHKSPSPELDKAKMTTIDSEGIKTKTPEPEKPKTDLERDIPSRKEATPPKEESSAMKTISRSPEPFEQSRSKTGTPEPLKTKSPSQESLQSSSPKPESLPKTLKKRPSSQKLSSKSPSPDTGHRTSNPPSLPPTPEPINSIKSPSPDLTGMKPQSPAQLLKDVTDSRASADLEKRVSSGSPDVIAVSSSPSPDQGRRKNAAEEAAKLPTDGRVPSESSPKPADTGKISPMKHHEEDSGRPLTPRQVKSPVAEKPPPETPKKSISPDGIKTESPEPKKSPSPISPKPVPSESLHAENLDANASLSPKSPSPVPTKPASPVVEKPLSPAAPKSPSPTAVKAPSPQLPKTPPTVGKPTSQVVSKSPSPVAEKAPSPIQVSKKVSPSESSVNAGSEESKISKSPEPMRASNITSLASSGKDKSPSPESDEQKDKPSPTERIRRPGSRQGISPEVVLSPSEDSGRTSASPEHFERKSSTPPKSASPLPSSRSPRAATPSTPEGAKESDVRGPKTPDSTTTVGETKATAASSPTSEVGDEASSTSRTESASARPSSAEAATPDDEAKIPEKESPVEKQDEETPKTESAKERKKVDVCDSEAKKKSDQTKPGTPSKTPRTPRSFAPSPRTPRRSTPRSRRKDGEHEKTSDDSKGKSEETKPSTNGEVSSPTKKSPTKIPAAKKSPGTPTAAASPARPPLKSPAKSKTPPALSAAPAPESDKKKVPMNKVQVGTAASPNLKAVRSKIGSLDNASYKPGGGKVKIENRKLDFSKTAPKIAAKNDAYVPGGGDKKIQQVKLNWSAKPKVGSLDNATYKPGGGEKKIETVKLDFKEKAKPKVGSKDNIKHAPGGGTVKKTSSAKDDTNSDIDSQKLEFKDKAQSKVGSMDNVKHKPGGGERKIFDDKNYLKQVGGSSSKASSEGIASGAQSPLPPMSPQPLSEENSVEGS